MKVTAKVGRETVTVEENMFDKAVRYFSPQKGKENLKNRLQTAVGAAMVSSRGGYSGASKTKRSMKNWGVTSNDADGDLLPDLPELRERSRDLVRNNPLATGAINTVCTSVVGAGLRFNSVIDHEFLGISRKKAKKKQREIERRFHHWASSKEADITRTQNFYESIDLSLRSPLENGDAFVLLPHLERAGSPYLLKFQFIEADRVCNEDNQADSDKLSGGIELDDVGAPWRAHILESHPGRAGAEDNKWQKVRMFGRKTGRRNILHLMERKRIGQNRGIPYLSPVVELLKQITDYTESEIMAALISSMFTVFIKSEGGNAEFNFSTNENDPGSSDSGDYEMGNGAIVGLDTNQEAQFANPSRPNSNFDPFILAILRQVGVALEIPYEILIKHFTASYSASMAAMNEAWRFYSKKRTWVSSNYCQPIVEEFISELVASDVIQAPGFFKDPMIKAAYCAGQWIGRPKGHMRPDVEVKAAASRMDNFITTLPQETAEYNGGDWMDNHSAQVEVRERQLRDGLIEPFPSAQVSETANNGGAQ